MMKEDRPVFFFADKKNDQEAYDLLRVSRINCYFVYSEEDKTPYLLVGYREHRGLLEIKKFLERWQKNEKRN